MAFDWKDSCICTQIDNMHACVRKHAMYSHNALWVYACATHQRSLYANLQLERRIPLSHPAPIRLRSDCCLQTSMILCIPSIRARQFTSISFITTHRTSWTYLYYLTKSTYWLVSMGIKHACFKWEDNLCDDGPFVCTFVGTSSSMVVNTTYHQKKLSAPSHMSCAFHTFYDTYADVCSTHSRYIRWPTHSTTHSLSLLHILLGQTLLDILLHTLFCTFYSANSLPHTLFLHFIHTLSLSHAWFHALYLSTTRCHTLTFHASFPRTTRPHKHHHQRSDTCPIRAFCLRAIVGKSYYEMPFFVRRLCKHVSAHVILSQILQDGFYETIHPKRSDTIHVILLQAGSECADKAYAC